MEAGLKQSTQRYHANRRAVSWAIGRYLQLRFDLAGDGRHSPGLKSARIYFPRDSYLRYLPAVYRKEAHGQDFLERFLSVFESMSLTLEDEISDIPRSFDAAATDPEFVDWLGSWLAVLNDANWPEAKKRDVLKHAFQLYQSRGTPAGLQNLISLLTGADARILDHFRLRSPMVVGVASTVGQTTHVGAKPRQRLVLEESSAIGEFALLETEDPPERPFAHDAYDFTVLADTSRLQEAEEQALDRLIQAEKPAHTRFFMHTSRKPAVQLGVHNFLDINTKLSNGFPPMRLGQSSRVGQHTFLGTSYPVKGTLGSRSRIAIDTTLQ